MFMSPYILFIFDDVKKFLNCFFFLLTYLCFRVIDGFEALEELEKLPVNTKNFKPLNDVKIQYISIHANPLAT